MKKRRSGKRSTMKKRASIWDSENKTEIDKLTMIFMIYKFLCVTMSAQNWFLIPIHCFLLSDFCDTFRHFVTSNILPFHAHMNQCGKLLRKVLLVKERIVFMFLASLYDGLNILEDSTYRWHQDSFSHCPQLITFRSSISYRF